MAKTLLTPVFVVMRDCVITINPGFVNPEDFKLVVRSFDHFDPNDFADPYLSTAHLAAPGQYLFTECLKGNPFTLLEKHTDWLKYLPQKRKVFGDSRALLSKVNEAIYTKEERLEIYKCLYSPKSLYLSNGNAVEIERKNGTVKLRSVMNISPIETDDHYVLWQTPGFSQETSFLRPRGFMHFTDGSEIKLSEIAAGGFKDQIVARSIAALRRNYINVGQITYWSFCN